MDFNLVSLEFDDSWKYNIVLNDDQIMQFPGVSDINAINNHSCLKEIVNLYLGLPNRNSLELANYLNNYNE